MTTIVSKILIILIVIVLIIVHKYGVKCSLRTTIPSSSLVDSILASSSFSPSPIPIVNAQTVSNGNLLLTTTTPISSEEKVTKNRKAKILKATNEFELQIPKDYNSNDPPPTADGGPTHAEFYILLVDIRDVNEVEEELVLEYNLQMFWKDARFARDNLPDKNITNEKKYRVINPNLMRHIWHPDIFIDHVKQLYQPTLISIPESLRIYYSDMSFRYSGRFCMKVACQMDFHLYPADTQRCAIDIKSYAYSNDTLFVDWKRGKKPAIKRNMSLPNFNVALAETETYPIGTSSSTYNVIRFTVVLRRHLGFHLIQTYLPSCLFVVISFLTFLVSRESVLECLTLCMTTLLTLTAMFAAVKQNTPSVSYVKGLDIWMVTCIFCVFFTLLEHTVLLKLRHQIAGHTEEKEKKEKEREEERKRRRNRFRERSKSIFALGMMSGGGGAKGDAKKRHNTASSHSQEPLTPFYRKNNNDKSGDGNSSGSCSGSESSPVVQIRKSPSPKINGHIPNQITRVKITTDGDENPKEESSTPKRKNNLLNPELLNPICLSPALSLARLSPGIMTPSGMASPDPFLLNAAAAHLNNFLSPKATKKFKFSISVEIFFSKSIPLSFLIFNCIYWPWLLLSADYYNETEFKNTRYA